MLNEQHNDDLLEMPFLRNIGLIMTYKCQIACPHCILEAGPHRKEQVRRNEAFDWIEQVAGYRGGYIKVLSLTGGEPFYNIDNLKKISDFGEACGLFVSAVTNAFWATTPETAVACLEDLGALKMLSISADAYHQKFIPFERVRNAVQAADACGIPYTIAVCTEDEADEAYLRIVDALREITAEESVLTAITFPAGRALKRLGTSKYRMSQEPPMSACAAGSSPIIFPDGRVIACIGPVIDIDAAHPLVLGNLREEPMQDILDRAESNPILHAIRIWGPRKLIAMAHEAGLSQHLPDAYIEKSLCNACYSLMSNGRLVDYFAGLAEDWEFQRTVAYARVYYLDEPAMVERMGVVV